MKSKIKKIISLAVTVCFIATFVVSPLRANGAVGMQAAQQYKQIFSNFVLPYSYGQITGSHYGATDRVLINIQDLHCHPKVQKNISNIIELFDKKYGINKVFLEGAYGQVSTKWISDKINRRNKNKVLEMMLDTGRLTGAEYYSAKSDKTEIIEGLEKKEPYLDNLKRFGQLLEEQDKIALILKGIEDSTKNLKEKYYDKRQKKLETLSQDFKSEKISSKKYYTLLLKHTDKLGIDITKYENTFTYIMLLELQKNLDYAKITKELQELVLLLKGQLPYNAYKMLLEHTDNFTRTDSLYSYIIQICRAYNLDLSVNFSNLDKYFRYIELSQKINPIELIAEEEKLRQEINTRFSRTKAQREVVFLINFERYLKDYITTKITSSDYKYYKENIAEYKKLWNKYADNRVLSLLDGYMEEVDKFYEINSDRNLYFTDNLFSTSSLSSLNASSTLSSPSVSVGDLSVFLSSPSASTTLSSPSVSVGDLAVNSSVSSLRGAKATKQSTARSAVIADSDPQSMLNETPLSPVISNYQSQSEITKIIENMKDVKTIDIVITGGFHSQTVTEILKDKGVSYIVITPNVTGGVKEAEDTYYKIAKEQSKISFQTLANLIASLSPQEQIKIIESLKLQDTELKGILEQYDERLRQQNITAEQNPELLGQINDKILQLAKILDSDDAGNDIRTTVIELLKGLVSENLQENITPELIEKLNAKNAERLKALLENRKELEKFIEALPKSPILQAAEIVSGLAQTRKDLSLIYRLTTALAEASAQAASAAAAETASGDTEPSAKDSSASGIDRQTDRQSSDMSPQVLEEYVSALETAANDYIRRNRNSIRNILLKKEKINSFVLKNLQDTAKAPQQWAESVVQKYIDEARTSSILRRTGVFQTESTVKILTIIAKGLRLRNPEKFRYNPIGAAIGVLLEIFSVWLVVPVHFKFFGKEVNIKSFSEQHGGLSDNQKIAVQIIRGLSIAAFLAGLLIPVMIPLIAAVKVELIAHYLYNIFSIATGKKENILQTGNKSPGERLKEAVNSSAELDAESIRDPQRREYLRKYKIIQGFIALVAGNVLRQRVISSKSIGVIEIPEGVNSIKDYVDNLFEKRRDEISREAEAVGVIKIPEALEAKFIHGTISEAEAGSISGKTFEDWVYDKVVKFVTDVDIRYGNLKDKLKNLNYQDLGNLLSLLYAKSGLHNFTTSDLLSLQDRAREAEKEYGAKFSYDFNSLLSFLSECTVEELENAFKELNIDRSLYKNWKIEISRIGSLEFLSPKERAKIQEEEAGREAFAYGNAVMVIEGDSVRYLSYEQYSKWLRSNKRLTMTWLSNLLDRLKITDFDKRQRIINIIENPIIVLGTLFPTIGRMFARAHLTKEERKSSQEVQEAKASQVYHAIEAVVQEAGLDLFPTGNIAKRLIRFITTIFNRQQMQNLATAHTRNNVIKEIYAVIDTANISAEEKEKYKNEISELEKQGKLSDIAIVKELIAKVKKDSGEDKALLSSIEILFEGLKKERIESIYSVIRRIKDEKERNRCIIEFRELIELDKDNSEQNIIILFEELTNNSEASFLKKLKELFNEFQNRRVEEILNRMSKIFEYSAEYDKEEIYRKRVLEIAKNDMLKGYDSSDIKSNIAVLIETEDSSLLYGIKNIFFELQRQKINEIYDVIQKLSLTDNEIKKYKYELEIIFEQDELDDTENISILLEYLDKDLKSLLAKIEEFFEKIQEAKKIKIFMAIDNSSSFQKEDYKNKVLKLFEADEKENTRRISSLIHSRDGFYLFENIDRLFNELQQRKIKEVEIVIDSNELLTTEEKQEYKKRLEAIVKSDKYNIFILADITDGVALLQKIDELYFELEKNKFAVDIAHLLKENRNIGNIEKIKYENGELKLVETDEYENEEISVFARIEKIGDAVRLLERMRALLKILNKRELKFLDIENNGLALKIFLSEEFIKYCEDNNYKDIIRQYRLSIKAARKMYEVIGDELQNISREKFNEILFAVLKYYEDVFRVASSIDFLSNDIAMFGLYNREEYDGKGIRTVDFKQRKKYRMFSPKGMQAILEKMGIKPPFFEIMELYKSSPAEDKKNVQIFLDKIVNFNKTGKERGLFIFSGHGLPNGFFYNGLNIKDSIKPEEIAEALIKAYKNGVNLEKITLYFSNCYSYDLGNIVIQYLQKADIDGKKIDKFPQIVAEAGKETEEGFSSYNREVDESIGNLEYSILDEIASWSAEDLKKRQGHLTFADIVAAPMRYSNHTLFMTSSEVQRLNKDLEETVKGIMKKSETDTSGKSTLKNVTYIGDGRVGKHKDETYFYYPSSFILDFNSVFYAELQTKSTVKILQKFAELIGLKNPENFRYNPIGLAIGDFLELFSIWLIVPVHLKILNREINIKSFEEQHGGFSDNQKTAAQIIRGLGIAAFLAGLLIPVMIPLVAAIKIVLITHYLYNVASIATGKKENILQTTSDLVVNKINPIRNVIDFMKSFLESLDSGIKFDGQKIIMVSEEQSVAVPADVTKINYSIEKESNTTIRGGTVIGITEGKTIRAKKKGNSVVFYSKQGLDGISQEQIEELFIEAFSSSSEAEKMPVIAFAKATDITQADITNRLEVTRKYGIVKAETEIKFDLRNEKFGANKCDGENASTGANTFIITPEQAQSKDMESLRNKGYGFVVSYKVAKASEIPSVIELDGIQIDATEVTEYSELLKVLNELKKMCNVEKSISIQINENLYGSLQNTDVFKEYGVLPVVSAENAGKVKGRKEVTKISEQIKIEDILRNEDIVGVIADEDSRNLFSVIKDMLKIKTSGYEKGLNAGLREGHKCDMQNENLRKVLTTGTVSLAELGSLGLQTEDELYIKYLLEKEREQEAAGFVIGIAMSNAKKQWKKYFNNIDEKLFAKEAKGRYEKGLLLMLVSMQVSGMDIAEMFEKFESKPYEERGWNMSAEQMYRQIGEQAFEIITKVLEENDKKIKVLSAQDIARALEDFNTLNTLILDRFRIQQATQGVQVSYLAVKSMLSAA